MLDRKKDELSLDKMREVLVEKKFPLLNRLLSNQQKIKTLLMLVGSESVGSATVPEGYERVLGFDTTASFIHEVHEEFQLLGFFAKSIISEPDDDNVRYIRVLYSKSVAAVDKHSTLYAYGHAAVGQSFGFPETAVASFPDDSLHEKDLPLEVSQNPLHDYLPFLLSRAHAMDEWQWFVSQLDEAKKKYPELIKEFNLSGLL